MITAFEALKLSQTRPFQNILRELDKGIDEAISCGRSKSKIILPSYDYPEEHVQNALKHIRNLGYEASMSKRELTRRGYIVKNQYIYDVIISWDKAQPPLEFD